MDRRMMMLSKTGLLPEGYTQYDYLYNSGSENNDGNWIDTGLLYSPSFVTLNLEFEATNSNTSLSAEPIIGANNTISSDTSNILWYARASKGGFSAYNLAQAKQLNMVPSDARAIIKYVFVDGGESYIQWESNTVPVATVNKSSITANNKTLILCGGRQMNGNTNTTYSVIHSKVGYVKFTDPTTDELVYNFIPAYGETEGKYGYYETVQGVFYYPTGTKLRGGYWE